MTRNVTIVKLGGSVITNKQSNKPSLRGTQIQRLAREIAQGVDTPLIILHGAGSFGHPLAHQYRLSSRTLSREALVGMGLTTASVRTLGNALARNFLDAGIPVVPLQTSSLAVEQRGRIIVNYAPLEAILARGGVPLLGGDVVVADGKKTIIVSADRLAVELAQHFKSKRIIFATDVDGVFDTFPPKKGVPPLPVLNRSDLSAVSSVKKSSRDVTGAMGGKLQALLSLRTGTVHICNGLTPGVLREVLKGKARGTTIIL